MDEQEEIREEFAHIIEQIADKIRRDEVSALVVILQDKNKEDVEVLYSHKILAVAIHIISRR